MSGYKTYCRALKKEKKEGEYRVCLRKSCNLKCTYEDGVQGYSNVTILGHRRGAGKGEWLGEVTSEKRGKVVYCAI